MDVEIQTTTGTWVASVDPKDLPDTAQGSAAAHVQQQLLDGQPLEVRQKLEEGTPVSRQSPRFSVVFNPAHLVCVAEPRVARRRGLGT